MNFIDSFLNNITMYRLMLYYLIALLVIAGFLSIPGVLPFNFFSLTFSVAILVAVSVITNRILAKVFQAPTNVESVYITSLILALIITPIRDFSDVPFLFLAGFLSQTGKYILAVGKKHIFNPAALAVVLTAVVIAHSASWWIGNTIMLPFVTLGGFFIVRKIRRWDLVLSFLLVALVMISIFVFLEGNNIILTLRQILLGSPLFFLALVMLTEPLTTPPTRNLRVIYGGLVGFLFTPQMNLGNFYIAPEMALLIGNIFAYFVSSKQKLILKLQQKRQIAPDIYDFIFQPNQTLNFVPGQYVEWTLEHQNPDSRGNRRYFTIASSPTEGEIRLGVRVPAKSSSFKKALMSIGKNQKVVASQLAGDFTLPQNLQQKLVFIAGGIGVTPFRSMIKYLMDNGQKRDIVLFYSSKTTQDLVYKNIFNQAVKKLGIEVVYVITDKVGRLDASMITKAVPDFQKRIFYLSGPSGMITSFEQTLQGMGISSSQIKTDYFPGY